MLTPIALLVMVIAGWLLGRARPKFEVGALVLTVFAAITAHSGMQAAFFEGRLDQTLGDPREGANQAVIFLIAAGEAVGLWVPWLLLPWTRFAARLWGALYALAAATLAAAYFYAPFDLVVVDRGLILHDGPPYLLAAIVCVPIAGLGYLLGLAKSTEPEEFPEPPIDR